MSLTTMKLKPMSKQEKRTIVKQKTLESRGYEIDRSFFSEVKDGEAILYRKKGSKFGISVSLESNVCCRD